MQSQTPAAFISYSSIADRQRAEDLYNRLSREGIPTWFDVARLEPGFEWHAEIAAACAASRVVLAVLTPRWKQSEWTRFETYGAEFVIPLLYEGTFDEVTTPPLRRFQTATIALHDDDPQAWSRFIARLRACLEQPAPAKAERLTWVRYTHDALRFVGRERDLNQIHDKLWIAPTAALTHGRVDALTALGGVGKTALARAYVEKFGRLCPQIFWINCRAGLESEFAGLFESVYPERAAEVAGGRARAAAMLREFSEH